MTPAEAFVVETPGGRSGVRSVELDSPRSGEVVVRVVASGVCATDHHAVIGTSQPPFLPAVLGHEGAGTVVEVGADVATLRVGDSVLFGRSAPCGSCQACRRGRLVDCDSEIARARYFGMDETGSTRLSVGGEQAYPLFGGTLSELTVTRADHLVRIDADVPLDLACLLGCAVVTGVGAVANVARTRIGDSVLIMGCGGIGLNAVQGARIAGASTIIAVDRSTEQLELARRLGATHVEQASPDLAERVESIVPGGVDAAFEAVGRPELVASCMATTRVGGTTVMIGVPPVGATVELAPMELLHGRRLLGCRGGSALASRELPLLVDLYRSGALQLEPLVGRTLELRSIDQAWTALAAGDVGRSVVRFD